MKKHKNRKKDNPIAKWLKRKMAMPIILLGATTSIVLITLIVTAISIQSNSILSKYNSLSGRREDSKEKFGHQFFKVVVDENGNERLEIIIGDSKGNAGISGVGDSDSGTPNSGGTSTGDSSGNDGSQSGGAGIAPPPQAPPITDDSNIRDILAKIYKESSSENGYLAALSCVASRAGSSDPNALLSVMSKEGQFEGYRSDATYASVTDNHRKAIDRFIAGERLTDFKYFVGPAGAYDIYAKKGSTVFSIGIGDNYYSAEYRGTRATNKSPGSNYILIYDRKGNQEVNCVRNGFSIIVNN